MKSVVLVGSKSDGCGACTADAVVVCAFFLAVARLTRMGRLLRIWAFISVSARSRSGSAPNRTKP
jgi:hypothetical protein